MILVKGLDAKTTNILKVNIECKAGDTSDSVVTEDPQIHRNAIQIEPRIRRSQNPRMMAKGRKNSEAIR